jgi:hypothetical protein
MSAQFGAKFAAVRPASDRRFTFNLAIDAIFVVAAISASGCTPATTHFAEADPANPAARVAGVGYRSTIAPYSSMRPSTPAPWRERNDSVTRQPGTGREPQ